MASRTVRRVKREKVKESANSALREYLPAIVVTPPDTIAMKVKALKSSDDKNATTINKNVLLDNNPNIETERSTSLSATMPQFTVNQLIAELSQNSMASKTEIEQIQRRLLQQANEILKVNAFANPPAPEPRFIDSTQKYSKPVYGRIPVILPRNGVSNQASQLEVSRQSNPNTAVKAIGAGNQLDTQAQLVPEKLQEKLFQDNGAMINSAQGNMQRVATAAADAGRGVFFYETGFTACAGASPRSAPTRGECLSVFQILNSFASN